MQSKIVYIRHYESLCALPLYLKFQTPSPVIPIPVPFSVRFSQHPDSMQIGKVAFNQQPLLQHPHSLKRICFCHNKIYLTLHDALHYCSNPNSSSSWLAWQSSFYSPPLYSVGDVWFPPPSPLHTRTHTVHIPPHSPPTPPPLLQAINNDGSRSNMDLLYLRSLLNVCILDNSYFSYSAYKKTHRLKVKGTSVYDE